jgi:hypothetical protein
MHASPRWRGPLPKAARQSEGTFATMNASFHIVGCVVAVQPAAAEIEECIVWMRRHKAAVLSHDEREMVFVRFDATDAALILFGCRVAAVSKPPLLRFGFASGVKEAAAGSGQPRMGERGITQACDLARAAQAGQVLVSSQLGSLLQVAQVEPHGRLRPMHVRLQDGRIAAAYEVEPRRRTAADDGRSK